MAYITLSRSALFHNLDIIARKTGSVDKIALVLKDNAYGHGIREIGELAHAYGIRRAVVRHDGEARQLEGWFDYVLVLAQIPRTPMPGVHYTINALEAIARFPAGTPVELKVDTGMHRNGVAYDELEAALIAIEAAGLTLKGVFTHHRSADELSSEWFWQVKRFEAVKAKVRSLCVQKKMPCPAFHSANSAAAFRGVPGDESMVRVGIAAYGCLRMAATLPQPTLRPVLSLWAERIATRRLEAGACVGYGATYCAAEAQRVSTYDAGYADGLIRAASNRYRAPGGERLLGRISMDNATFEGEAEALCIFDDASAYAQAADSFAYEVLVRLGAGLPRRVVE